MIKVKNEHNRIIKTELILLYLFILFAIAPNWIKIHGYSIKPMYIVLGLLTLIIFKKGKIIIPPKLVLIYFGYILFLSFFLYPFWGIDRLAINYAFGLIIIIFFMTFGKKISCNEWEYLLQNVWIGVYILIFINNIVNINSFFEYKVLGWNHPDLKTIIVGGVNIESTWISILALSFLNHKYRWIPLGLSGLISVLYVSRAGMIATGLVALFFIFGKMKNDNSKKKSIRIIISIIVSVFVLIILFYFKSDSMKRMISRFLEIGKDPGSMGRFAMWKYIPNLIIKYPFGVGLGNSIKALETVSPLIYEENNVHNLYLQMFCETGVLGGALYISIWIMYIKKVWKIVWKSPIAAMIAIYGFLGMLQFRGGETIFFILVGIYLSDISRRSRENNGISNSANL